MGKIEIIIGCMFSGKTTELIRRVSRYKSINKSNIIINSKIDNRYDGGLITHSGSVLDCVKTDKLMSIVSTLNNIEVIGVDEAQFFDDLYTFALWCESNNKILIIAGLDGDTDRKPFGDILSCIPICDSVIKLTAMDKDGKEAIFTIKKVQSSNRIEIGNNNIYQAVTRQTYVNFHKDNSGLDEYECSFEM
jgi:thymidine kinase